MKHYNKLKNIQTFKPVKSSALDKTKLSHHFFFEELYKAQSSLGSSFKIHFIIRVLIFFKKC